ncbi:Alpha/Beta hydrolase protein [Truncatella angustata]|uniref:Alpha/Beta hydrolase protein n=1 Tax=Truncatella angustata TaxID=152316 RepID=A0A9P8UGD3_9PEZI|nr:Alpha/Beta hydrolase protein [Truncatella angustata]KAH6651628.1 Alpha/Beta hydrolase protein [Truncatella angustata]
MSSPSDYAVVICHGSYHSPEPYRPLVDALKSNGFDAYCPQLPTADLSKLNVGDVNNPDFDREPPAGGYPQGEEDTEAVLSVLEPLIQDKGKRVLIIGHSAGGWVATQAARPELQLETRKAEGQSGGIVGILYMGAFIIPVGESVTSFFQPKDGTFVTPPFMKFHKHGGAGLGTMVEVEKFLFNDVDREDAKKWSSGLTASPVLTTKLTNDAYAALPCAYLVLEGDLTLPKEYQEGMVAQQSQKTGEFTVYRSPAGHSPHISWTEGVIGTVRDFLSKVGLLVT